jgi:alkylation response protein AidB-like acyl-CoA dehydrogenase
VSTVDFTVTAEQDELRAVVRQFLTRHAVCVREPGCYDEALWRRFAVELGLAGLAEASLVEVGIVLEESGRALLALPYLSTVVASLLLPPSLQASIMDGSTLAALALDGSVRAAGDRLTGLAPNVADADVATLAIVAADGGLFAAPLDGVARTPRVSLDQSRPLADLAFDATPARRLAASPDQAGDLLHLALAVEALGTAAAGLEATVTHLRSRHQFGVALATFQALRHRVADLAVELEAATSTTGYAVRASEAERPLVAPMAKLVAADAAYAITAESIQLHGGIGFTWEHEAHRRFKRATVTRLSHGDPVALRRLIGERAELF